MIKKLKSNKILVPLLIIMCIIIMIKPLNYAKACLNGISAWAFNVLPVLFPFFVLTRLIVTLNENKQSFMDKFFCKAYNVSTNSFNTYFLSTLSGYPMGAKLIGTMYENKQISKNEAKKMLSFCSVSGPMFMVGTVGLIMLKSYLAGLIILISNVLASLINGLLFRGKKDIEPANSIKFKTSNKTSLSDIVYDSLISILMVGAYIALSFLIISVLNNLHIIEFLSNTICSVLKCNKYKDVVQFVLCGGIEITNGILGLSSNSVSLLTKTILASGLIGFGGISVILQSLNFISKIKIPFKTIFLQKLTQGLLSFIIAIPLCIIFLLVKMIDKTIFAL